MNRPFLIVVFLICIFGCKDQSKSISLSDQHQDVKGVPDVRELTSDFKTWWTYQYNQISLSDDFQAMDENSELISKKAFLQKLTTVKFIVISVTGDNRTYMLNEFTPLEDKSITRTIIDQAKMALHFYQLKGIPFPDFKVKNIDDQEITNKYFIGKTTILKTWFISCKPCIAEMPELNKLVDKYSNTDI